VQVSTVGPERFVDAGRCAGTHLHLELPAGTVDAGAGQRHPPGDEGLHLVLEACNELEAPVSRLRGLPGREGEPADVS